ncbi:hypothetical protein BGC31_14615 [Komagataeibacter xylinus]|nr:hypothetical protein H845_2710 [Komagataeibacter xylinus E25]RFP02220.1 hypothetical protein BGC31_14615 [Komagataeibacter xylinus]RFP03165.1 hypothetical protein BFX83_10825 [Komagataeibacter xylinus]
MLMEDEDGLLAERRTLLDEIRSDVQNLSASIDPEGPVTDSLRSNVAVIADKLDALSDLMR